MATDDLIVDDAVKRVLEAARGDWVQLVELQGYLLDAADAQSVELWDPNETSIAGFGTERNDSRFERRLGLGMRVVHDVLSEGALVPGDLSDGFLRWPGNPDEWQLRIEQGWRHYGTGLNLNDVCWFSLTP